MTLRNWDSQRARQEIARLLTPGVLGHYTHFEATEVFATAGMGSAPFNVFSIFVAEERAPNAAETPHLLNHQQRIKVKSLPEWNFGINRYVSPIAELLPLLDALCDAKEWRGSGHPLHAGELISAPPQFVPPDFGTPVPWNRVLKNNFWNGSHVFEWADAEKTALQPLFDDPRRLQELSDTVRAYAPLGLASFSDRLGSIVIQLPVTVLIGRFAELQGSGDFRLSTTWSPQATPRPLRASCAMHFDDVIAAFRSVPAEDTETQLPMYDGQGLHHGILWDDANGVLLAATGEMSFVSAVVTNLYLLDPEPRVFVVPDGQGGEKTVRIGLIPEPIQNTVGEAVKNPAGEWTQRRIYKEETDKLLVERRFVQYKPEQGVDLRAKALADIRWLIDKHGEDGVWLWDPYLSADDIINTLFHCRFFGANLRGLTAGDEPASQATEAPPGDARPASERFSAAQNVRLTNLNSNFRGLDLEYRIRTGSAGWGFHDRFLIFPATDRAAKAWSLGTSVNSLGDRHHILQQVGDGQRIRDAFAELWDALDRPENLIWKTP
jgi:hypothetical protein